MILGTMTRKYKVSQKNLIVSVFIFLCLFTALSASDSNWVIAAEKFSLARGQKESSVTQNIAENLPSSILEKLGEKQFRNVEPSERLERTRYKLKTERQSLYLQLSSEYKKRDAIFLNDYSDAKLKKKLKEEDKKIKAIEDSLKENLESLKEEEEKAQEESEIAAKLSGNNSSNTSENEFSKFSGLLKNIFTDEESVISLEAITFYKGDAYILYKPSDKALEAGYESSLFAKEIYSAGVNTLITGSFSVYGEYISVSLNLYLYPQAVKIGSVMEVGSLEDLELLTNSLAGQLIPLLTNAMPVEISIELLPKEALQKCQIYIDDVLHKEQLSEIIMESGRHTIQISSEEYESLSFNEYFDGNGKYKIEIDLEERKEASIQIGLIKPIIGDLFINGQKSLPVSQQRYIVQLNGSHALGEFINAEDETAFFYIPEKLLTDGNKVKIKPKAMDRGKNIDTRRKWMYASYSLLMVSLIPYFYTYGNYLNRVKLYNDYEAITYEEAIKWQKASNICRGISVACGVLWGVELVRYFLAANSVLPQKAKSGDIIEILLEESEDSDVQGPAETGATETEETSEVPEVPEGVEDQTSKLTD